MRFVSFSSDAQGALVRPGVLVGAGDQVLDLEAASGGAIGSINQLVELGDAGLEQVRSLVLSPDERFVYSLREVSLHAPLRPLQLRSFSVYAEHVSSSVKAAVKHTGRPLMKILAKLIRIPGKRFFQVPLYYKGTVTNFAGPGAPIMRPPYGEQLDYELELAVIIGRKGKSIAEKDALQYVFGYTIYNDVSARKQLTFEVGLGGAGPAKGKDFDGSNIIGPWIVTPDEIANPMKLAGRVRINGELKGEASTSEMSHSIQKMIAYISNGETLYPGEMFGTGAMPRCCGIERWEFLNDGDVVELEFDGIGTLRNIVQG